MEPRLRAVPASRALLRAPARPAAAAGGGCRRKPSGPAKRIRPRRWADLPPLAPEVAARVARVRVMMTGDPAFQYSVEEVGGLWVCI
jgi:hypothetical protein